MKVESSCQLIKVQVESTNAQTCELSLMSTIEKRFKVEPSVIKAVRSSKQRISMRKYAQS